MERNTYPPVGHDIADSADEILAGEEDDTGVIHRDDEGQSVMREGHPDTEANMEGISHFSSQNSP
jgi:hypothetical protein